MIHGVTRVYGAVGVGRWQPSLPVTAALAAAGKVCTVVEWSDGRVAIRHAGNDLPCSVFDKNPIVAQTAIVENKRLSSALSWIQEQQLARDEDRLANPKLTVRQKNRIRSIQEEAAVLVDGNALTPPPTAG